MSDTSPPAPSTSPLPEKGGTPRTNGTPPPPPEDVGGAPAPRAPAPPSPPTPHPPDVADPSPPFRVEIRPGPAQREIAVFPSAPLRDGEGIVLRFESGEQLHLVRGHEGSFRGLLPRERLEDPFNLYRTPGGIREVGFHGQSVPRRSAALIDEPLWVFPVAWQDRLPRSGYPTRSGVHQDMVLPPSERSPEERVLRIHLPETYLQDTSRLFPVVYCLDGQNCFDASISYGGVEWCLDDIALELEAEGGPPCILVGIDNGGGRRMYEYSYCLPPSAEGKSYPPGALPEGGGAQEHLEFILYEVAPVIRRRFRIAHGPGSLVGSSMGGLFGLWAAITHPGAFRSVAAISPSVWWANEGVLTQTLGAGPRPRVWIDMGTREGKTSVEQFRRARKRLEALGWHEGRDLHSLLVEGGTHHESAWADRGASIMRFLLD